MMLILMLMVVMMVMMILMVVMMMVVVVVVMRISLVNSFLVLLRAGTGTYLALSFSIMPRPTICQKTPFRLLLLSRVFF